MIRSRIRTARKTHRCVACPVLIRPGQRYRESVTSPRHEHPGDEHWRRTAECADCAGPSSLDEALELPEAQHANGSAA